MSVRPAPINYYDLLQINPRAETEAVERVYRMLAMRYQPDNKESGDPERFRLLQEAYETLRDPLRRARYDAELEQC
jgi:curved DNA-binding protein CbpA